jgi:hypothetical protein
MAFFNITECYKTTIIVAMKLSQKMSLQALIRVVTFFIFFT